MDNVALFFLIFELKNKSPLLDSLMIFGAEYLIYAIFALIFILALKGGGKEKKALLLTILGLGIAFVLVKAIRLFFPTQRPFEVFNFTPLIDRLDYPSFPSAHTTIMSVVTFAYIYYRVKIATVLPFLLLWVGIARVYTGVHYPLDIVGGIVAGLISVHLAWQIKKWLVGTVRS